MNHQDVLTHLRGLAGGLDAHPGDLAWHLESPIEALRSAVTGSAGFQLTVVHQNHPVTLTFTIAEQDNPIKTSLRLPLPLLSPAYEPGGLAILYSTVPGAFIDLAADLTYVLHPIDDVDAIVIDLDLPPGPAESPVSGLDELAALHRAAGILIAQGHHPDTAHQALATGAAEKGLPTLTFALQLLGR